MNASMRSRGSGDPAQAKWSGYGIASAAVGVLEGGVIRVDGEDGVALQIRAGDAKHAAAILAESAPELDVEPPETEP